MTNTKQDERTPGPWYHDGHGTIFIDTRAQECCGRGDGHGECCGVPNVVGDYGPIATASKADAEFIVQAVHSYTSTDALRSALAELLAATIKDAGDGSDCPDDDGPVALCGDGSGSAVTFAIIRRAIAALSGSPAPSTEGLREALEACIDDILATAAFDGIPKFEAERSPVIVQARTALVGVTAPSEVDG